MRSFGNYVLLEELSAGRASSVHVAQRIGAEDLCVIKMLHEVSPILESRFRREAEMASLLDHANIARLLDAGREGGVFFIATELVPGADLAALMPALGDHMPTGMGLRIVLEILAGLHHAHELRSGSGLSLDIVHRDVAPKNVMIGFRGEVKLIDFGVARGQIGDFRTAPGMVVGTLRYMSPEQAWAEPIDRRSDVYSVAVVLYELLTKRPGVPHDDARAILTSIATETPPPPSTVADVPAALDGVVMKALSKSRDDRFSTASTFADAIRSAVPSSMMSTSAELGALVAAAYPEARSRLDGLLKKARAGTLTNEPTSVVDHPSFEPTHGEVRASSVATPVEGASSVPPEEPTRAVSLFPRPVARRSMALWGAALVASAVALLVAVVALRVPQAQMLSETAPDEVEPRPTVVARPPPPPETQPPSFDNPPIEPAVDQRKVAALEALLARPAPAQIQRAAPSKPKRDPAIVRLAGRLKALEAGRAEPAAVLDLAAGIKAEAGRIADPAVENAVRRKAHSSGAVGDLQGLREALDALEAGLSPPRRP